VAEMVHAATIAIVGEVSAARLVHAVPSFPTRSEVWVRLLAKYQEATRLRPQARASRSAPRTAAAPPRR
jgi:hypothetical protein